MSAEALLGIAWALLTTAGGFVWRHLEGRFKIAQDLAQDAAAKADRAREEVAAVRLKIAEQLVNHDQLDRMFDEKLDPIIHAVNAITEWIERQNGVPTLRGRIPTGN